MSSLDPFRQFLAQTEQCTTRDELSGAALGTMRSGFGVHAGAVVFFDEKLDPLSLSSQGIRDVNHDEYVRHWRDRDPVLARVVETRLPASSSQLYAVERWRETPFIREYGRKSDVESYMIAPIYGSRGVVGAFCFFRHRTACAFDREDLTRATVFAGVLSSSFAALPASPCAGALPLTRREKQVALLAARGLRNPEIAKQLGLARETVKQALSRVYGKLGLRGRTELAVELVKRGWL